MNGKKWISTDHVLEIQASTLMFFRGPTMSVMFIENQPFTRHVRGGFVYLAMLLNLVCMSGTAYSASTTSTNVGGNIITTSVNLISGNILDLEILTTSIDSVLFDQEYSLQLLGSGGSGNYIWSVSSGSLPPGFSLDSETGVLSGNFNYVTLTQLDPYEFTISLSDECFPVTTEDNTVFSLDDATQSFSLGPDTESYCWDVYESGGLITARSLNNSDFAYIFYEGKGVDMYFGTQNAGLDLPSSITIDGEEVTPTAIDPNVTDPSTWTSSGVTLFKRYRLAEGLDFGDHVIRIAAPSSGNRQVAFQELEIEQGEGVATYYQFQDILPEKSLYRCSAQRTDLTPLSIDPDLVLKQRTLLVTDLPAGIETSTTTSSEDIVSANVTISTNTTTSDNTTISDNTTTSDNITTSTNTAKPLVLSKLRFAASEDDYAVFFEIYDENSNRIDTIFENSDGELNIPPDNTRVKLVYMSIDDPRERYESPEESIESVLSKAAANAASSSSSSSSSDGGGGGGGGCLIR